VALLLSAHGKISEFSHEDLLPGSVDVRRHKAALYGFLGRFLPSRITSV
jgi:hypothetical protein